MTYTVEFVEDVLPSFGPDGPTFGPQDPPTQRRITLCEPTGKQGQIVMVVVITSDLAKVVQGDKVTVEKAK